MRVARMVERWRAQGGGDQFRGVSIAVSRAFACATQRRLQSTAQCEIKARHQAAPALSTYEVCNLGERVGAHKDLSPMCTAEFYFDRAQGDLETLIKGPAPVGILLRRPSTGKPVER